MNDLALSTPSRRTPRHPELEFLWLDLTRAPWNVLAVVAAGGGVDAGALGAALAETGALADPRPVRYVDARQLALEASPALAAELAADRARGLRVVVAVGDVEASAAAVAVVRAADAALLAVQLGRCEVAAAKRAVERCGTAKFIGSVAIEG